MINPDRIPDIRPDRRRFHFLRALAWIMGLGGLAGVVYGAALGALAYYGTKNGTEGERLLMALGAALLAVLGGLVMIGIGQVFRVVIAIEENTRLTAFHTRPRPAKPPRRLPRPARLSETESKLKPFLNGEGASSRIPAG